MLSPLSFTPEFRRKVAELPKAQRREWLCDLAGQLDLARARGPRSRSHDDVLEELAEVARGCRVDLAADVENHLGPFSPLHLRALREVPRERFVRDAEIGRSADDTPLPLDDEGHATISAPHAYLLSFRLLELGPGDRLLELGAGSGYGAALASSIVGGEGQVVTVEIDAGLCAWASARLSEHGNVRVIHGDAVHLDPMAFFRPNKITVTFAVDRVPHGWTAMLPEGGRLAVPVGPTDRDQRLVLVRREKGELLATDHGAVRYVQNRSPAR